MPKDELPFFSRYSRFPLVGMLLLGVLNSSEPRLQTSFGTVILDDQLFFWSSPFQQLVAQFRDASAPLPCSCTSSLKFESRCITSFEVLRLQHPFGRHPSMRFGDHARELSIGTPPSSMPKGAGAHVGQPNPCRRSPIKIIFPS